MSVTVTSPSCWDRGFTRCDHNHHRRYPIVPVRGPGVHHTRPPTDETTITLHFIRTTIRWSSSRVHSNHHPTRSIKGPRVYRTNPGHLDPNHPDRRPKGHHVRPRPTPSVPTSLEVQGQSYESNLVVNDPFHPKESDPRRNPSTDPWYTKPGSITDVRPSERNHTNIFMSSILRDPYHPQRRLPSTKTGPSS